MPAAAIHLEGPQGESPSPPHVCKHDLEFGRQNCVMIAGRGHVPVGSFSRRAMDRGSAEGQRVPATI
jgi:hypothetical protein